jgi:endonuclease/exonuclease/phosphatase family metal-dependent hydrolase
MGIKAFALACALAALASLGGTAAAATESNLSVMSYNVHGLPWPMAAPRHADFKEIAARLRALRAEGRQPHVVVLQEAFTRAAKRMAAAADYPFVAAGPGKAMRDLTAPTDSDRRFLAGRSWMKGEGVGKAEDSGLMILSDYPILSVRRAVFPAYACAGFDCLANKGVMLATLRLPDGELVQVATTHFNSRRASKVPLERSLYAYHRQVDALGRFLRDNVDAKLPLILAGDFNVLRTDGRRSALMAGIGAEWQASGYGDVRDALRACARPSADCTGAGSGDAAQAARKETDWQFFGPGARGPMEVRRIDVPFGHDSSGRMLSDHIGYQAEYSFGPAN